MSSDYYPEDGEDPVVEIPEEDIQPTPPRSYGPLFIALGAVAAVGVLVWLGYSKGTDYLVGLLTEYWPVLAAPVAGWLLGGFAVKHLYRPSGRVLVSLDPATHTFRAVFVPEEYFRYIEQAGNNVVYHTPSGTPVYTVTDMDLERGRVDYGWVHESDAMVVMTREDAYLKWNDTLNEVLRENLELMDHPAVIALGLTRTCLRRHLDEISGAVGLTVPDYEGHAESEREPEDEQGD